MSKFKVVRSLRETPDNSDVILIGEQKVTKLFRNLVILSSKSDFTDLKPLDRLLDLDGIIYIVVPDVTIDISNILLYLK